MIVISAIDPHFDYEEAKSLWTKHRDKLDDGGDFDKLLRNSHFFSFYENDIFIGCMCFYQKDDKLFFNGFSKRKCHLLNLRCIKKALTFYNTDVYAQSIEKPAIYCLLKAGFHKVSKNLYMKGNKNG